MSATIEIVPDQSSAVDAVRGFAPINRLESFLIGLPQVEYPLTHWLEPGLYIRQAILPANTIFTTKIHRFEHRYLFSKGAAHVFTPADGWRFVSGRFWGITKALTRRVIVTVEETTWTTFHKTNETDLVKIEAELIVPHDTEAQRDLDAAMQIFSLK